MDISSFYKIFTIKINLSNTDRFTKCDKLLTVTGIDTAVIFFFVLLTHFTYFFRYTQTSISIVQITHISVIKFHGVTLHPVKSRIRVRPYLVHHVYFSNFILFFVVKTCTFCVGSVERNLPRALEIQGADNENLRICQISWKSKKLD